jgi:hypothetical protein
MIHVLKIIVTLLMFLTVLFFINTMLTITTGFSAWLSTALSFACAAMAVWFTWKLAAGKRTHGFVAVISGALILGGLFFTLGFLGPMVFAKDTNQGPLIGVFIAAPLGVIVGAIAGYVYASKQHM